MAFRSKRKGLTFRQSPHDESAYSATYYNYSPTMALKVEVTKDAFVRKDDLMGTVTIGEDNQQLLFTFPGRVTEICKLPQIK